MSAQSAKKLRQIYRRDVKHMARIEVERMKSYFKPKPKWIPWKVWIFLISFFIRVK